MNNYHNYFPLKESLKLEKLQNAFGWMKENKTFNLDLDKNCFPCNISTSYLQIWELPEKFNLNLLFQHVVIFLSPNGFAIEPFSGVTEQHAFIVYLYDVFLSYCVLAGLSSKLCLQILPFISATCATLHCIYF